MKRDNPPAQLSGDELKKWQERRQRQTTQEFADYATAHGRADLASAAWSGLQRMRVVKNDWAAYFVGQDRDRFRNVEEPYAAFSRYLRLIVGQAALLVQAGLAFLMALMTALLARRFREKQQVSWLTAFCVAMVCWLPAAVLLYSGCQWMPNPLGMGTGEAGLAAALIGASIFLPFVLEDLCWGARNLWLRLRRGKWSFDSPPLLPRTGVMLALLSLFTYAALLVPLNRAEKDTNTYIKRIAGSEVQVAREAVEKAKQ